MWLRSPFAWTDSEHRFKMVFKSLWQYRLTISSKPFCLSGFKLPAVDVLCGMRQPVWRRPFDMKTQRQIDVPQFAEGLEQLSDISYFYYSCVHSRVFVEFSITAAVSRSWSPAGEIAAAPQLPAATTLYCHPVSNWSYCWVQRENLSSLRPNSTSPYGSVAKWEYPPFWAFCVCIFSQIQSC